ncbi:MAG: alpha-2-macroglobulin family protein [Aureliella sp.]
MRTVSASRPLLLTLMVASCLTVCLAVMANSPLQDPEQQFDAAQKAFENRNFNDAIPLYRSVIENAASDTDWVTESIFMSQRCFRQIGTESELDQLLNNAVETHAESPEVYAAAAKALLGASQYGMIVDGEFLRGNNSRRRVAGTFVNCAEQDRGQALRWIASALSLVSDQRESKKFEFQLQFANTLLHNRSGMLAWRLQNLTNFESELNYTDQDQQANFSQVAAPVDSNGNPLLYDLPTTLEAATSDGERLRWALNTEGMPESLSGDAILRWARFLEGQFSVRTLSQYSWMRYSQQSDEKTANSILRLHTLSDSETSAKLANGVKRFLLPDEHHFIHHYKQLLESSGKNKLPAATALVDIYLNRRQFEKAAALILEHPELETLQSRLPAIMNPRITFDALKPQTAGKAVELSFVFRNADRLQFEAQRVDLERLIRDVQNHFTQLTSSSRFFNNKPNARVPNLVNPQSLFREEKILDYVTGQKQTWTESVQPLEKHWDKRLQTQTPISEAGLYVVHVDASSSASQASHSARILVWVTEHTILQKPLAEQQLFAAVHTADGTPVTGGMLEFFGWRWDGKRQRTITKRMAINLDQIGEATKSLERGFQWLTILRVPNSPPTLLNFRNFYSPGRQQARYQRGKAYGVCSQPIYRPGNTAKIKFWCAYTTYGDIEPPRIAETRLEARVLGPQGTEIRKQIVTTDEFGSFELELDLAKSSKLGYYRCEVRLPPGSNKKPNNSRNASPFGSPATQSWPTRLECSTGFLVEEFRKPEFEVEIQSPEAPVALGQVIAAEVVAKYYIGTPVSGGTAKIRVTRSEYSDSFYPAQPYDWCYGPGYWWYSEPCVWHPNWDLWRGCLTPQFGWYFPRSFAPPELVSEMEVTLDSEGKAKISIDTQLAKDLFGEKSQSYNITATVTDLSRRSIAAQGNVVAAAKPFKVYTWTDRGFYKSGDEITASFQARTLDSKPVAGTGTAELLRINLDANNEVREVRIASYELETAKDGSGEAKFRANQPGQYRVRLKVQNKEGQSAEGGYVFYVRGEANQEIDVRFADLELTPELKHYSPGETLKLQISSDQKEGHVLLFVRPESGVYSEPQHIRLEDHTAVAEILVTEKDAPNFFVEAVTVFDGELHSKTCQIVVPPAEKVIQTTVRADKEVYEPGEQASFTVETKNMEGKPVAASILLACYDRSLEAIASQTLPTDIRAFFWKWQRSHFPQTAHSLAVGSYPIQLDHVPRWSTLGIFGSSVADTIIVNGAMARGGPFGVGGGGGMYGGAAPEAMALADGAMESDAFGAPAKSMSRSSRLGVQQNAVPPPSVRNNFADSVVWFTATTDDQNGIARTSVDLPDNLTGWRVGSWGVGRKASVGSAQSEITTKKSFFVRLQTPRFLVAGDQAVLSAIVHNDANTPLDARLNFAIDGETQLELINKGSSSLALNPKEQRRVDFRCTALAPGTVSLRVEVRGQTANGNVQYSDALKQKLTIVPFGSPTQEAWAGTLLAKDALGSVKLKIPAERIVEKSELIIRMTPSLAFAMVESLPYLAEYPYGCTEQTLNRFLPAVQTKSALERIGISLKDIERRRVALNPQELRGDKTWVAPNSLLLKSPLASEDKLQELVDVGVQKLTDFQNPDGGWGWFPGSSSRSSAHITALVLRGLTQAKQQGVAIVPSVMTRGQQWLTLYQDKQLAALKNWDTEQKPRKQFADNTDAFVFQVLATLGTNNPAMLELLYRDRGQLSCYGMSLVALACKAVGDQDKLAMLRRNIEQFLVVDDENQTAFLSCRGPNWYWYGSEIESNATFLELVVAQNANDPLAPKLIKYLLNNRPHATYWNSTRDTAVVISAFTNYLEQSEEAQQKSIVDIFLDDKRIGRLTFSPDSLLTGENTVRLSGSAVPTDASELTFKRVSGSGNLYWNVYSSNYSLADQIEPTGLEVRVERKFWLLKEKTANLDLADKRGQIASKDKFAFERIAIDDLTNVHSGEQVEVELILKSKNDYEYLLVEDKKPAGFETVSQNSGYFYSGGLFVYRELREKHVGLCIERLNRGEYSMKYRLRAESPGTFNALPATIEGMYAPELFGNSANQKLNIIDSVDAQ